MNPGILKLILNAGKLLGVLKDLEKTVADAVAGQNISADLKQDLTDLAGLVEAGVLGVPGLTTEQLQGLIADIKAL